MSKSLFTGRTASRTKSQTEQWYSSASAPKHAARFHCHSFLVNTKTRIVRQLSTICPVKNRCVCVREREKSDEKDDEDS